MMPVRIGGRITIGASGAVASSPAASTGIASVTRISAGRYRITLQDGYSALLSARGSMECVNATTASGIMTVELLGSSVAISTQTGGTLDLICFNSSGVATDPANGSAIRFDIWCNNSSVQ